MIISSANKIGKVYGGTLYEKLFDKILFISF